MLWRVSIRAAPEAEEAVMELLQARFCQPASAYTDLEKSRTDVSVYLPAKPLSWTRTKAELLEGLRRITRFGLDSGPAKVALARLFPENWAESWKRHFHPLEIGSRLLIQPSWSRRRPRPGQALVVLDPGLSFGTGQHPTTAYCLRQLVVHRRPADHQSFLDLGTGSGILAISAARLGYGPILAMDYDAPSIQVARANARSNRVAEQIRFLQQDLRKLPLHPKRKFSIICANLLADLLIQEKSRILSHLQPRGLLVLSGILRTEFLTMQQAYKAAGLRLISSRAQAEWRSGTFAYF